ncbi:MAG: RNA-dependent DNA polymerase, partial [Clostridiales bacterium]|nr:RNA-dependent DNA polymerase [Clostridiales bacterium]
CAYNLAKKIFAPYRFIKTEGEIPYGAISRNRQARRILQQRRNSQAAHKAVAA